MKESMGNRLHLKSLNHISIACRSVEKSLDFYQNDLGFFPIRRPGSLDFTGAWLFNYGIGIHLLQSEDPDKMPKISQINPKDNHISFQCESMALVEKKLKEMRIEYVKRRVKEGGINVDQLFFHDPDGTMIEICNCDNLPVIPLESQPISDPAACISCSEQVPHQIIKQAVQMKHQQHQQQMPYMPPSYAHQERLPAFCMNGEFLGRDIRFNLVNQLDDVPEIRMCMYLF